MDFIDYDTRLAAYAVIVDRGAILLSWFNGGRRGATPGWTLPGGGVDFGESLPAAVAREVREETGYDVEVGDPLVTDVVVHEVGPRPPRPYQSVRILLAARIVGGTLGTLEIGGTTDRAAWVPLDALEAHGPRVPLVDLGLATLSGATGGPA